jgi:transcriptional regulator with XRE-family HTH domain
MEARTIKRPLHLGSQVRRMRAALGVKQAALAGELGTTQQNISRIEQEEHVEEQMLNKIAGALGVSKDAIKSFGEENAAFEAAESNHRPQKAKDEPNDNDCVCSSAQSSVNLIEKLVELVDENRKLYERLLASEREKAEILQQRKQA